MGAHFAIIKVELITDRRVSAMAFRMYCLIASYANGQGSCFPSVARLAGDLGIKERQARYLLAQLVEFGAIERSGLPGKVGTTVIRGRGEPLQENCTPAEKVQGRGAEKVQGRGAEKLHTEQDQRTGPLNIDGAHKRAPDKSRSRGSRIDPSWQLSELDRAAARKIGLTDRDIDAEANRFKDYWLAKAGRDATKLDWPATWRLWCSNALKWQPQQRLNGQPAQQPNKPRRDAAAVYRQLAGLEN